jgi:hypothetical protein
LRFNRLFLSVFYRFFNARETRSPLRPKTAFSNSRTFFPPNPFDLLAETVGRYSACFCFCAARPFRRAFGLASLRRWDSNGRKARPEGDRPGTALPLGSRAKARWETRMDNIYINASPLYPEERVFAALAARNPHEPVPVEKLTQAMLIATTPRRAAEAFLAGKTQSWRVLSCFSLAEARPLVGELSEALRSPDRFAQWGRVGATQQHAPWVAFFEPDSPKPFPGERGARQIVLATGFDAIVHQCAKDGSRLACALSLSFLRDLLERMAQARNGVEEAEFVADFNAGLIAPPMPEEIIEERQIELEERLASR